MSLDLTKLKNVKTANGKTTARCPACKEVGGDEGGDHLVIYPDDKYGCVVNEGNSEHRKRIFALVGVKSDSMPRAEQKWPTLDQAAKDCTPKGHKLIKVWCYTKDGRSVGGVARYEPPIGDKTFRQFHPVACGWQKGGPKEKWPLLGFEKLPATGPVVFVEGEKTFEAAISIGLPAVCSAGGAGAAKKSDWSPLAGREVWGLLDNNAPGESYGRGAKAELHKLDPATAVRFVRLPGVPDGGDLVDWLAVRRGTKTDAELRDEIEAMAQAAPTEPVDLLAEEPEEDGVPEETEEADGGLTVVDAAEYVEADPPEQDPVIEGVFERGDKVELISGSKQRKTFFLILLFLYLAVGRDFLNFKIPKRRRVMWVNMELKPEWSQRRIHRLAKAAGIAPDELRGWFLIVNARSKGGAVRACIDRLAAKYNVDIVGLDPRYKLMLPGEIENAGEGLQGILDLMDRIAESGPAVLAVHHDPKGDAGDRAIADRGSGSNWAGRDVDARFTLTQQRNEPETASVVETMCRNYSPVAPFSIRWKNDMFALAPELDPVPFTRQDHKRQQAASTKPDASAIDAHALAIAREPMGRTELLEALQNKAGVGRDTARACLDRLEREGRLAKTPRVGRRNGPVKYGLPEVIHGYMNPKLAV